MSSPTCSGNTNLLLTTYTDTTKTKASNYLCVSSSESNAKNAADSVCQNKKYNSSTCTTNKITIDTTQSLSSSNTSGANTYWTCPLVDKDGKYYCTGTSKK